MKINTISVPIQIKEQNGSPFIFLCKKITDPEIYKPILSCAWHDKPIIIMPSFTDKIRAISTLQEKGILYYNSSKSQYYFTL